MSRATSAAPPIEAVRRHYAKAVLRMAGVDDPRIEACFAEIPREAFLTRPPWTVLKAGVATQTNDVADLYQDVLVALDRRQGINNGEPALHAAWLAAVAPQAGETAIHVGTGGGYYTAMLARLVAPDGQVEAYESHLGLAAFAGENLRPCRNVTVQAESAFGRPLPAADIVYVNAGVFAPDPEWLRALTPGGRLIFPWQPTAQWGPAMLVRRRRGGFSAEAFMSVGFVVCSGQPIGRSGEITRVGLDATRSVWLKEDRSPDETATAVYDALWFSAEPVDSQPRA